VPELWRYDGNRLEINVLKHGRYVTSKTSLQFPNISVIEAIPRYLNKNKVQGRNRTMREFRAWVAEQSIV